MIYLLNIMAPTTNHEMSDIDVYHDRGPDLYQIVYRGKVHSSVQITSLCLPKRRKF